MRIGMVTREWPPNIYGGAGVHVEQLVAVLRKRAVVDVHCFGAARPDADAHEVPPGLSGANFALQTLGVDLEVADVLTGCDIVHSHTWYANLAGHLGGLLHGVPHVITAHSLEPRRPWKEEQLGGGYRISSWVERAAYREAAAVIAVSAGMRDDVLDCYPFVDPARVHVVHNGIDTAVYQPDHDDAALRAHGIDPGMPYVLFVGRITRQKGISHLLRAAEDLDDGIGLVLCASAPDTPELGAEVAAAVAALQQRRGASSVVWIEQPLPRPELIQVFTHAAVFACPSIYEPLGIVNLEAMACETPVVASAVGGIPEVVVDGVTGTLVPYDDTDAAGFETAIAAALNAMVGDRERARQMGRSGRERAVSSFGWDAIAERTLDVYAAAVDS